MSEEEIMQEINRIKEKLRKLNDKVEMLTKIDDIQQKLNIMITRQPQSVTTVDKIVRILFTIATILGLFFGSGYSAHIIRTMFDSGIFV